MADSAEAPAAIAAATVTTVNTALDAVKKALEGIGGDGATEPDPDAKTPPPVDDSPSNGAIAAVERYRSTMRWMVGAFATVGLLVFGSLPFTGISEADGPSKVAIILGILAVGVGVVLAIWANSIVAEPVDASLGELGADLEGVSGTDFKHTWGRPRKAALAHLKEVLESKVGENHFGPDWTPPPTESKPSTTRLVRSLTSATDSRYVTAASVASLEVAVGAARAELDVANDRATVAWERLIAAVEKLPDVEPDDQASDDAPAGGAPPTARTADATEPPSVLDPQVIYALQVNEAVDVSELGFDLGFELLRYLLPIDLLNAVSPPEGASSGFQASGRIGDLWATYVTARDAAVTASDAWRTKAAEAAVEKASLAAIDAKLGVHLQHREMVLMESGVTQLRGNFRLARGFLILGAIITTVGAVLYGSQLPIQPASSSADVPANGVAYASDAVDTKDGDLASAELKDEVSVPTSLAGCKDEVLSGVTVGPYDASKTTSMVVTNPAACSGTWTFGSAAATITVPPAVTPPGSAPVAPDPAPGGDVPPAGVAYSSDAVATTPGPLASATINPNVPVPASLASCAAAPLVGRPVGDIDPTTTKQIVLVVTSPVECAGTWTFGADAVTVSSPPQATVPADPTTTTP